MNYEGGTESAGGIADLQAQIDVLDGEVKTLQDDVTTLQSSVVFLQSEIDVINTYFNFCDPSAAGALINAPDNPPLHTTGWVRGAIILASPPGKFFGDLSIFANEYSHVMLFEFTYWGLILQPYASPNNVNLACFVGVGGNISIAFANPVSDDTPRGVPQFVSPAAFRITNRIQISYDSPDQFGVASQTERSFDNPNIPTNFFASTGTRPWTSRIDFEPFMAFTSNQPSGYQINLQGFTFKRII